MIIPHGLSDVKHNEGHVDFGTDTRSGGLLPKNWSSRYVSPPVDAAKSSLRRDPCESEGTLWRSRVCCATLTATLPKA